jgi:pyruvate dehydrogenase phosphatase
LVVEQGQLYSGVISGPLSKETDGNGRKVLEMMTPEQATQRLRKNEESWLIGRGRGVVRYDVVQLPSNDPIEDDHAEKIIEVPQTVAATGDDGQSSTDWMFWGVFDGHR